MHHDSLYLSPEGLPDLKGLRILRSGWYLGEFKKGRFEPSHALALGLTKQEVKNSVDFPSDSQEAIRYLKGETLETEQPWEGYCLVTTDGYPLGWGKVQNGRLKNKYPPGWKWE